MYRIANVTDRSGKTQKPERIGEIIYDPEFKLCSDGEERMYAEYAAGERVGKAMLTSPVVMDSMDMATRTITVVTENSVYTLERVQN